MKVVSRAGTMSFYRNSGHELGTGSACQYLMSKLRFDISLFTRETGVSAEFQLFDSLSQLKEAL